MRICLSSTPLVIFPVRGERECTLACEWGRIRGGASDPDSGTAIERRENAAAAIDNVRIRVHGLWPAGTR